MRRENNWQNYTRIFFVFFVCLTFNIFMHAQEAVTIGE